MKNLMQSVKENLSFVAVCLLIFAALVLVAWLFERFVIKERRKLGGARYVATMGMCAALGAVLMVLEIPVFFAPPFYKLDFSEIPMLFCSFYLGPVAGVLAELLKNLIKLLLKGTSTAFVGEFANFAVSCALVLPASILYHIRKTKKSALVGLATGTVMMTVFGSAFDAIYLLPKFAALSGWPVDAMVAMGSEINGAIHSVSTLVLYAVAPLNLLKGVVVSAMTFLLYKRIERVLFRKKQPVQTPQASNP